MDRFGASLNSKRLKMSVFTCRLQVIVRKNEHFVGVFPPKP